MALLLPIVCAGQLAIEAVAPELPPLVIALPGAPPAGLSVELVQAVAREAGLAVRVDVAPFARALHRGTHQPGVLLFPLVRTPEREENFVFLGPVNKVSFSLFRKRDGSSPRVATLGELDSRSVGVINKDAAAQYLADRSVAVVATKSLEQLVEMLAAGRLDYAAQSAVNLRWQLKLLNLPLDAFEEVLPLPGVTNDPYSYLVVSKQTDPALIRKFQEAFARIQRSGEWNRIYQAWTVRP